MVHLDHVYMSRSRDKVTGKSPHSHDEQCSGID